jgi:hypothetical protein
MRSDICEHGILIDACVPCAVAIWRAEDEKGEVLAPVPNGVVSIELDAITHRKLLEFCEGRDLCDEIYSLVLWAQKQPSVPATVKTISKYYDTEKYKAIAKAEIKRTSPEVLEGQ